MVCSVTCLGGLGNLVMSRVKFVYWVGETRIETCKEGCLVISCCRVFFYQREIVQT